MPITVAQTASANSYATHILGGRAWASMPVSYSFPSAASNYGAYSSGFGEPDGFSAFSAGQKTIAQAALAAWAAVCNVTFNEITESDVTHALVRLATTSTEADAESYFPHETADSGGDSWFNSGGVYVSGTKGTLSWWTFVHELGHSAIGLCHPHSTAPFSPFTAMPTDHDSVEYTVMSYCGFIGDNPAGAIPVGSGSFPTGPMMFDIFAAQHVYGANRAAASGQVFSWSPTTGQMSINGVGQGAPAANKILCCVWAGGGNATYDFSNQSANLLVDLRPGEWTTLATAQLPSLGGGSTHGSISNALDFGGDHTSQIKNVICGTGDDTVVGNDLNNTITVGIGNNTVDGGPGTNTVVYARARSAYTQVNNAGVWTVSSVDGTDTLTNVQLLQFSDGTFTIGSAESYMSLSGGSTAGGAGSFARNPGFTIGM